MEVPLLDIEVVQKRQSCASAERVNELVMRYVRNDIKCAVAGNAITSQELQRDAELAEHVEDVRFCDDGHRLDEAPCVHTFRLEEGEPETDTFSDGQGGEVSAATLRALPARALHGLWQSLRFECGVHRDLLRYAETALTLAGKGLDARLAGGQRLMLLHGPPGTGKTSLCRALAHKLAARMRASYPRAALLEVDAHALFSRWFSESGRLVAGLFGRARELAEDPRLLLILLLDEVESLATARGPAAGGLEPADGMRAVNALLTQLDVLRSLPNVLVLATSNLAGAVDAAFLDRADLVRRVGLPGHSAAYAVLCEATCELMRAGAIQGEHLLSLQRLESMNLKSCATTACSLHLRACAASAVASGLSGRALRRLPLLALSLRQSGRLPLTLDSFLCCLEHAITSHKSDTECLAQVINDIHLSTHIPNGS